MITAIARHERRLLMCCDLTFKVMRTSTVLQFLVDLYTADYRNYQDNFSKALLGTIVMTRYNNKTYRVDDIDWEKNLDHRFVLKDGTEQTIREYYRTVSNFFFKAFNFACTFFSSVERLQKSASLRTSWFIHKITRFCHVDRTFFKKYFCKVLNRIRY